MNSSTQFINAVEHLKAQRRVIRDGDIAEATGVNKSQVSMYLSGKLPPSKNFVAKFEKHYNLSLADYNEPKKVDTGLDQLMSYQAMQVRLLALIADAVGVDKRKIADVISINPKIMEEYFETMSAEKAKEVKADIFLTAGFKGRVKKG